jgi:hypothetical protein
MSSRQPVARHFWIAGGIAVVVGLLLALACEDVVREFFPFAEEWKIMPSSLPQFAHVSKWFAGFAAIATDPYPAWAVNSINFLRPMLNFVYWLRGEWFGEHWGAWLYFNFAFLALSVGVLYLMLRCQRDHLTERDDGVGLSLALLMTVAFIAMPPLVSATSSFQAVLLPQMCFGRLLAIFILFACLSFSYRRYLLATLFLVFGLLTKEQGAPVAMALPLVFAWLHRRELHKQWPRLLLLLVPIIAWFAARLLLFGSVSQNVYVLMRPTGEIVHQFVGNLLKLPFYSGSLSEALHHPASLHALLVMCNLGVLAWLFMDNACRWRKQGPDVFMVTALGYWSFLGLVGLNPRYGTALVALTALLLARPAASRLTAMLRPLALLAFVVTGAGLAWQSFHFWPVQIEYSKRIYAVGRDYAEALAQVGPHPVVVLNDPNTMYTAPSDMALVLGLPPTAVYKASDYPWQWPQPSATRIAPEPCSVEVQVNQPGVLDFEQSCGLQIMGALVPNQIPLMLPLAKGIQVSFPQAHLDTVSGQMQLGQRLVLRLGQPGVRVLYFEPDTRQFHILDPGSTGLLAP